MYSSYRSRPSSITYNPTTSKFLIEYDEKTIETTVTDKSSVANSWIQEITSLYANSPLTVVGLDIERKPHAICYMSNKSATLQLCIDNKCLILQLFYMDEISQSLNNFLGNPKFIFVGIEVDQDTAKLVDEYGLVCLKSADIRIFAKRLWPLRFRRPGLKDLAMDVVDLYMENPKDVCKSNWEARVLSDRQVEYACIDAYASYKIGHKLLIEM